MLTEEQRLAKGLVDTKALKERVLLLAKVRKTKRLQRKGVAPEEGVDLAEKQRTLLADLDKLGAAPVAAEEVKRAPTPEIEQVGDEAYAERIGAPPPRVVDELAKFEVKEIYDAALERSRGAAIPSSADEQEWDQEYYERFEDALKKVDVPTYSNIDALVRKDAMKNKQNHQVIMCVVESRLQEDGLKPLQVLTAWYVLDALMKQLGGHFIADIRENLQAIVQGFMKRAQINEKWRTRTRDMLRSWREVLSKEYVQSRCCCCCCFCDVLAAKYFTFLKRREVDQMLAATR